MILKNRLGFVFHFSHNIFWSYSFWSSGSSVSSSPPNFMFSLTLLGGIKVHTRAPKKEKRNPKINTEQTNMKSIFWPILGWSTLPSMRPAFGYGKHTQSRSMNENWVFALSAVISCKYLFGQRVGLGAYFPLSVLGFCLTNLCWAYACCQSWYVWNCISLICLENSFNTSGSYCLSFSNRVLLSCCRGYQQHCH